LLIKLTLTPDMCDLRIRCRHSLEVWGLASEAVFEKRSRPQRRKQASKTNVENERRKQTSKTNIANKRQKETSQKVAKMLHTNVASKQDVVSRVVSKSSNH
jgi:septum formation inhibitor MinC